MRASIADTTWEWDVDEGGEPVLPESNNVEDDLFDWAVKLDALEEERDALKRMIARLQERKKARETAMARIRERMLERMKASGKTTVKWPGITISRKKVPAKVAFAGDLSAVPRWAIRFEEKPDITKVKAHWKSTGEVVPGFKEAPEGETVSIRT